MVVRPDDAERQTGEDDIVRSRSDAFKDRPAVGVGAGLGRHPIVTTVEARGVGVPQGERDPVHRPAVVVEDGHLDRPGAGRRRAQGQHRQGDEAAELY